MVFSAVGSSTGDAIIDDRRFLLRRQPTADRYTARYPASDCLVLSVSVVVAWSDSDISNRVCHRKVFFEYYTVLSCRGTQNLT